MVGMVLKWVVNSPLQIMVFKKMVIRLSIEVLHLYRIQ